MLTVLALNVGRTVTVEELVDSLWGDDPPRTATRTLHGYASRLRLRLGGEAISGHGGGGYRLDIGAHDVDAACFEHLVIEGRESLAEGDADGAAVRLEDALALWRAEPEAELAMGSSGAGDVTRLVELHRTAEELWGEATLAVGQHREHLPDLERMVWAEPLRELRWELLMVALYRSDRQADALRAYGRARDVLIEELGIEPGPSLRSLEQAILLESAEVDGRFAVTATGGNTAVQVQLPPMLADPGPFTLVGRELERETLRRAWKDAAEGLRIVLLTGEPGIGKTRLATELAREIHGDGAIVLAGRCDEGLRVPYQPFAEALRGYAHAGAIDASMFGELSGELSRLVPQLPHLVSGLPQPYAADAETEQYRLFDAVASWLATISADDPVLLVLDDLQWATRPTLLLLRHLARAPEPLRLLIVGTNRDTEVDASGVGARLLSDIRSDPKVAELALGGLDETAVVEFVEAAAGHRLDAPTQAMARGVHARTEGNPLFVSELLRHLSEEGASSFSDGRWATDVAVEDMGIPRGVREVVQSRLARLSDEVNIVLAIAAVTGAEFDVAVVGAAVDFDSDTVIHALEQAASAGVLNEVFGRRPAYRFTHALIHATVYDAQSAARKARTHGRIAEAIEQVHPNEVDDHVAALARHSSAAAEGSVREMAVDYAARAGKQALAQLAFDEATAWYVHALELFERDQHADDTRRCELLIALGDAQRQAGDPAHRETLLDAGSLAEHLGDADRLACAAIANNRGLLSTRVDHRDDDKIRILAAALEAIGPTDSARRSRLLTVLSAELGFSRPVDREQLAREGVAVARRVGDPGVLLDALGALWAIRFASDHDERAAIAAERLELASMSPNHGAISPPMRASL